MSYERRHTNPGRRERAAGKRHRRGTVSSFCGAAVLGPLKAGSCHIKRHFLRFDALCRAVACNAMTVAESEKRPNGVSETPAVAPQPGPIPEAAHL